jgi:hypothetical protein
LTRRARATQSRIGCVARLKPSRRYGCDRSGAGVRAPDVTPYPQSQAVSPVRV